MRNEQTWSLVTAVVLALVVVYAMGMYIGWVTANFALLLLVAVVVSGVYWVLEKRVFLPQRRQQAAKLQNQMQSDNQASAIKATLRQPWWLEWTAGMFPVLLAVFLLRSFVAEPFRIPSGSMIPTLRVGDLILVNKFHYGIRLPVANTLLVANHQPQRGDVMVFRYPPEPTMDYIKRVVGLPGDVVSYQDKELRINGQLIVREPLEDFYDPDTQRYYQQFREQLGERPHLAMTDAQRPGFIPGIIPFAGQEGCEYNNRGVVCQVPPGHYFMMGDNRDNSMDSRFWGFVPDANIVGKAFFVWMNFSDFSRIGSFD
ncbi:MAG: signal peptidase [Pseudomonadota bacterium]